MTIRHKLTGYTTALVAGLFLLLAWGTARLTRSELYRGLDRELSERCRAVAEEVQWSSLEPSLPERHEAFAGPNDGFFLLDGDGRAFLERGITAFRPLDRVGQRADGWRWCALDVGPESRRGRVVVAHQTRQLEQSLTQLNRQLILLFPLVLLASLGGGWFLAGTALEGVDSLAEQLESVTENSLSLRVLETPDELGRLGRSFNRLLDRLQAAFDRQSRFTADASHELKTPLAVIRALSTQKLMNERTSEDYREALRQVESAASQMGGILQALLFLARCDVGLASNELEEVELGELFETLAQDYAGTLQVQICGQARVRADATQLSMLWQNVVQNALRHGRASRLTCNIESDDRSVRIRLIDNGSGISPDDLAHVLERFYRGSGARPSEGAGLGLALCHSIATVHAGRVRIDSRLGQGTTVTLELPR